MGMIFGDFWRFSAPICINLAIFGPDFGRFSAIFGAENRQIAPQNLHPRISGFGQCKNNCPGVVPYGIIGGGATLAGIAATSFLSSVVPQAAFGLAGLGMAGVAGVGGSMFLQSSCAGPFFCRAVSGRCCLVVFSSSGLVCPDTC